MYKILDENVQFIEKTMETNIKELTARGKSLAEEKKNKPESHIPVRCNIIITICNSDDTTQSQSQETHSRIRTQQIARKGQPHNVHGR